MELDLSKKKVFLLGCLGLRSLLPLFAQNDCSEQVTADARIERAHAWRPPFGLARVGETVRAVVEISSEKNHRASTHWLGISMGTKLAVTL